MNSPDVPTPPPAPAETKPEEPADRVQELQTKLDSAVKLLTAVAERVGIPRKREQSESVATPEEQAKALLARASAKIRDQRRQLELQSAKIEGFELAAAMVFAQPPQRGGQAMEPALEWEIDKFVTGDLE